MTRNKKLDLISLLLGLIALTMVIIGFKSKIPAPTLTGIGFLLIIWGIQTLK